MGAGDFCWNGEEFGSWLVGLGIGGVGAARGTAKPGFYYCGGLVLCLGCVLLSWGLPNDEVTSSVCSYVGALRSVGDVESVAHLCTARVGHVSVYLTFLELVRLRYVHPTDCNPWAFVD